MKHAPDTDFLREWLEETEGAPPDPAEGTREAMSHLDEIRQASRWWPSPMLYRGTRNAAQPLTTTDTTEYQSRPIPATNGRSATVSGRTQSMFSPAKAIAAGAVVFAIGGTFLIAQPFQQQGSVPSAANVDVLATSFTGTGTVIDWIDGADVEAPDGLEASTGTVGVVRYESSDPRIDGEITITGSHLADSRGGGFEMLSRQTYELTNAGGSWFGEGTGLSSSRLGATRDTFILVGRDGYEGLTAYVISEDRGFRGDITLSGIIFPSSMPEVPEPYAGE